MNIGLRIVLSALGVAALALTFGAASGAAAAQDAAADGPAAPRYSAAALYNEGNAAARAGQPAQAVLSYERARLLAPRDADIRANLQTVRQHVGLPGPPEGWFARHDRYASPDTLYWCGLVGLLLAGGGLIARRLRPVHFKEAVLVTAAGVVMTALAVGDAVATEPLLHESVVMQPAAVRASPVGGGDPLFTLAPAAVVRVQDRHHEFLLVRDAQGRTGWVARGDLQPIVPPDAGRPLRRT